ncbi:MAG TPA: hypothetical protein VF241_00105 [Propionibacteriaceae bacterium]
MVALQIHGVSEPTRRALSAEARARGESLQEYLLDILDHEARDLGERQFLAEWHADTQIAPTQSIDFARLIGSEEDRQEPQFARGG